MQEGAEELLQDTRILQIWKQSKKASNKVRDDMLKLGTHWNVARSVNRNKRPVSEVAKDLEEAILKKARGMLQSSVEKPVRQSDGDEADESEAKRVRKEGGASSVEKLAQSKVLLPAEASSTKKAWNLASFLQTSESSTTWIFNRRDATSG